MGKSVLSTARPLGRMQTSLASLACAAATLVVALALLLAFAERASADDFCVGPNVMADCPIGATKFAEGQLQDAIDATLANGAGSPDRIFLHSGTHASATGFAAANSNLRISGVGPTRPVLTIAGGGSHDGKTVISTTSGIVTFEDIAIELPAADLVTGLSVTQGGTIRRVSITGPDSTNATGFDLSGASPEVVSSSVDLPYSSDTSIALNMSNGNSLSVRDFVVDRATFGIRLSASHSANIQRATIRAPYGLRLLNSPSAVVSSSLFLPSTVDDGITFGYSILNSVTTGSAETAASVYNCTLIGRPGAGSTGVAVSATGGSSEASAVVDSSVIYAHQYPTWTTNAADGASLSVRYTRYLGTPQGNGTFTNLGSSSEITTNPGFVDATAGDFRLARDSALIDAGNPGGLSGSSSSDLAGAPRVASRGGGLIRDIGAYEVQSTAPVARISVLTPSPSTTNAVSFSAAESTDADGDAMTYSWRFDSKTFANGVTTSKLFPEIGLHTVELTVTDSTGQSASTLTQVNVARGFLAMKIKSQNVRASAKGRFAITVSCPEQAATNCTGRLIFETVKKIEARNYQDDRRSRSAKPKILRAANYVFTIEPGTTRKLSIQTYGTFQNVLKKHKKFKLSASLVSGSTANAILTANRPTFTLSAPKPKRR